MEVVLKLTPKQLAKALKADIDSYQGLNIAKSDAFKLILAIDAQQESWEFTNELYLHFKKEIEDEVYEDDIDPTIADIIRLGIPVMCNYVEGRGFVYEVDGFYKSGTISIERKKGKLIANSRYDEKTEITSPKDLVVLNHVWWKRSKDRFDGWAEPGSIWKTLFDGFKLEN